MTRHVPVAAGALLALLLTACSPNGNHPQKGTEMSPEDVKAQIVDLYEASAAAIAPDDWKVEDASWLACSDDATDSGVKLSFAASRTAPLPGAPADLAGRAQKVWHERGHDVTVEQDSNLTPPRWVLSDPPYLTGTHPDGSYYLLDVNDRAIYFQVTSACVPGDIFELAPPTPTP